MLNQYSYPSIQLRTEIHTQLRATLGITPSCIQEKILRPNLTTDFHGNTKNLKDVVDNRKANNTGVGFRPNQGKSREDSAKPG